MRYHLQILYLLPAVFSLACTTTSETVKQEPKQPVTTAPYYTSAFPDSDISEKLSEIQQSVIRIASTAFYSSYLLKDPRVVSEQLQDRNLRQLAAQTVRTEESTAGTAVVLAKNNYRAILLTCAHVVQYPDTVVKYRKGGDIPDNRYVESVTVKNRQINFALNLPALSEFEILVADEQRDLALLEINLRKNDDIDFMPLRLPLGNSKNLRPASFVYVLGYPKGYPMITRGIVSDPNRTGSGDYITDALFNRGVSGGLIIASKDNFRSFEWVGVANSAAANNIFALVPDTDRIDHNERLQPYAGDIYVEKRSNLAYGITQAISTGKITEFLDEHRDKIRGFRLR